MSEEIAVRPGDMIAGKYLVEGVLGKGQMGVIVSAMHLGLDRRYAIKLIADKVAGPEHRERFLREARAAVQLESQHVARVIDVGTLDEGAPYIVMELLRGRDLAAVIREDGPLPISDAVECVLQACEAIGEAHRAGIVHRDLKPANLFLTSGPGGDPCVKVLDFGVSKMNLREGTEGSGLQLTQDRQLLGSPLYMPPEQLLASKGVDARADIWSLGVVLYELCTGSTPFVGENLTGLTTAVLTKAPIPLSRHRPDVPPPFEAVVLACFAKERDQRFSSVAELAAALAPFAPARAAHYAERIAKMLGEDVQPARPTAVLAISTAPAQTFGAGSVRPIGGSTSAVMSPVPPTPTARRMSAVVVGGVLLAVATLGGVAAMRWRASGEPGPAASTSAVPIPSATAPPQVSAEPPAEREPAVVPATPEPSATASSSATVAASASSARPKAAQSSATTRPKVTTRPTHAQPPPAAKRVVVPEGPRQ